MEQKRAIYTVILGICMLLSLWMLGRLLLSASERALPPKEVPILTIEQSTFTELLQGGLPLSPCTLSANISRRQGLCLSLVVPKQVLLQSEFVQGMPRTALLLLPAQCKLAGCFMPRVQDGRVQLSPRALSLAGFALPDEAAGAITNFLNDLLARWSETLPERPMRLQVQDGKIELFGKPEK